MNISKYIQEIKEKLGDIESIPFSIHPNTPLLSKKRIYENYILESDSKLSFIVAMYATIRDGYELNVFRLKLDIFGKLAENDFIETQFTSSFPFKFSVKSFSETSKDKASKFISLEIFEMDELNSFLSKLKLKKVFFPDNKVIPTKVSSKKVNTSNQKYFF